MTENDDVGAAASPQSLNLEVNMKRSSRNDTAMRTDFLAVTEPPHGTYVQRFEKEQMEVNPQSASMGDYFGQRPRS